MRTDDNGYAAFTVQLGPESAVGLYDTEIEVSKRSYQSSFNQVDLNIISESQPGEMSSEGNNDGHAAGGDGGDGGDAVGGNAAGGDGGDGGDAVGGNAAGGDGGDGGDAVGLVLDESDCIDTSNGGNGGDGGDAVRGDRGKDGDNGADEMLLC
jgi:hypothetical protein